ASGQPVPIGLIGTTLNPMDNHQVLCCGYDDPGDGTGSLILYDNNRPGKESRIDFDLRGNMLTTTVDDTFEDPRGPLGGFFATAYAPAVPPTTVVLAQGLATSPTGCAQEGHLVDITYTARNVGYHRSPPLSLRVVCSDGTIGGERALVAL